MRSHPLLTVLAVAIPAGLIVLSGCGGSGNGSGSSQTGGQTTAGSTGTVPGGTSVATAVDISWGPRARVLNAPSSALSAQIRFVRAGDPGNGAAYTVDRLDSPSAYTATYPTPKAVLSGAFTISVEFYAQKGGAGGIVGRATTGAIVKPDGTLARADGQPLGAILTEGTIRAVEVVAPRTLFVGSTAPLGANAKDASGATIAVSPGSIFFQSGGQAGTTGTTGGGSSGPVLTLNTDASQTTVTGNRIGTTSLQAFVDGVASEAVPVEVRYDPAGPILQIDRAASEIAYSSGQGQIFATSPDTSGPDANALIGLDPATGEVRSRIALTGAPDALALSADGRIAWVGLPQTAAIVRVDLASRTSGTPIPVGSDGFGGQLSPLDLAVSPADPETVAVTEGTTSASHDVALFRNGARAPQVAGGTYEDARIAFNDDGTKLFGIETAISSYSAARIGVVADGLVNEITVRNAYNGARGGDLTVQAGRVYISDGTVLAGDTLARLGRFALPQDFASALAADPRNGRAYAVVAPLFGGGQARLLTFDTTGFGLISDHTLAGLPGTPRRLILLPNRRLALAVDGAAYTFVLDPARL